MKEQSPQVVEKGLGGTQGDRLTLERSGKRLVVTEDKGKY